MKDFIKKKMYLILLVVSFSTLFSAISYADVITCEFDYQCPPGMICVVPGNFCMEPAVISCTETPRVDQIAYCWEEEEYGIPPHIIYLCKFTGIQADECIMRGY